MKINQRLHPKKKFNPEKLKIEGQIISYEGEGEAQLMIIPIPDMIATLKAAIIYSEYVDFEIVNK